MRKRLRNTIKWGGTALTVLLLVVWVGSRWWWAGVEFLPTGELFVTGGRFAIGWQEPWSIVPENYSCWMSRLWSTRFEWWFDAWPQPGAMGRTLFTVVSPIWVIFLLAAAPTLWLWWRDRRRAPGMCTHCGYDLRGVAHEVCPECGAPPPQPSPAKPEEGVDSTAL